jgi:hypothetical protein
LTLIFAGERDRLEREHNERAWAVWHIAALPRAKKMPELQKLQHRQKNRRELTPDQMWAVMLPMTYSKH